MTANRARTLAPARAGAFDGVMPLLALLALLLAACGTLRVGPKGQEPQPAGPPQDPGEVGRTAQLVPTESTADRLEVQVDYVPRMALEFDDDEGPLAGEDLGDAFGDGFVVTGGVGSPGSRAGVQVARIELDAPGGAVLLQTFGIEAGYRVPLDADGVISTEFAGGLGFATIDVDAPGLHTNASAYVGSHLGLRIEPLRALSFTGHVGANVFFDPGDSEASAVYVAVGVSIRF